MLKEVLLSLVFANLSSLTVYSQVDIVPRPVEVRLSHSGHKFTITKATRLVINDPSLQKSVAFFKDYMQRFYHLPLSSLVGTAKGDVISLQLERSGPQALGGYVLETSEKG